MSTPLHSVALFIDSHSPHPLAAAAVRTLLALLVVSAFISAGYVALWFFILKDIPFIRKLAGLEKPKQRPAEVNDVERLREIRKNWNKLRERENMPRR